MRNASSTSRMGGILTRVRRMVSENILFLLSGMGVLGFLLLSPTVSSRAEDSTITEKKIVEVLELDQPRKWQLLSEYYKAASEFYGIRNSVVGDDEIEAHIRRFKEKPAPQIRKELRLKEWAFRLDAGREGVKRGYFSPAGDGSGWEKVTLPHTFNYEPGDPVRFGRLATNFGAFTSDTGEHCDIWRADYDLWYKQQLRIDGVNDKVVWLSVNSANLLTDVWVNEHPVMLQHLGLFPFSMDITRVVQAAPPGDTTIAFKVTNLATTVPELFYNGIQYAYSHRPYTEGRTDIDWINQAWGGLAGDVTLRIADKSHVADAFFSTLEVDDGAATVRARVTMKNAAQRRFRGNVRIDVSKWLPQEGPVVKTVRSPATVLPMNTAIVETRFVLERPDLWDLDQPNLYLAHVVVEDEQGRGIDDVYETFGVRSFKTVGNKFYLNNRKIVLRGTHDTTNYHNESLIAPSDRAIVKDILMHKRMSANCSRWPSDNRCNYKRIADYCDQMGHMVSWAGYLEMFLVHPEDLLYAQRDVPAVVRLLKNHPSILMWEMGDEVPEDVKWYEEVYRLVASEDDTRPIIPSGAWANFLVKQIEENRDSGLTLEQKRRAVLQDYPVFESPRSVWDFHFVPCLPGRGAPRPVSPMNKGVDLVKNALGGERPTIFTEFGVDGLPNYDLVKDIYGKFRWAANPLMMPVRSKYDIHNYGREIRPEDWKETQAYQSIVLENIIRRLRESPEEFSGYYFLMLYDIWTWYWGVADIAGNCKLAYFVVGSCYQPVYLSALHGNALLSNSDELDATISNYGGTLPEARLEVCIKDAAGAVVRQRTVSVPEVTGDVAVTKVPTLKTDGLAPGLYRFEHHLRDRSGVLLAKSLEMAFIE